MPVERFDHCDSPARESFNSRQRFAHYDSLSLMVLIGALCRLAFVFGTPIFYAPDEQSHFAYIEYLCVHHSFPIQTSQTGAKTNDWEYYQPPLYYLAMQPIYFAASALFSTTAAVVRTMRCASVACWLMTVWLAARFLRFVEIADDALRDTTMAVICLLPTYTFLSSAINNDNLLIVLGGGIFCLLVRRTYSIAHVLSLGMLLGLAMLTKLNAIVYLFACLLLICFDTFAMRTRQKSILLRGSVICSIAMLIWLPWGIRNWQIYGSMTAEHIANIPTVWGSWREALSYIIRSLLRTFWAVSGKFNNVYGYFPIIGLLLTGTSFIGLIAISRQSKRACQCFSRSSLRLWQALALTLFVNIALVFRFGILYRQAQGRFLFPLLIPIAVFFSCGANHTLSSYKKHVMMLFIGYAITFTFFSLWMFFRIT